MTYPRVTVYAVFTDVACRSPSSYGPIRENDDRRYIPTAQLGNRVPRSPVRHHDQEKVLISISFIDYVKVGSLGLFVSMKRALGYIRFPTTRLRHSTVSLNIAHQRGKAWFDPLLQFLGSARASNFPDPHFHDRILGFPTPNPQLNRHLMLLTSPKDIYLDKFPFMDIHHFLPGNMPSKLIYHLLKVLLIFQHNNTVSN
jgi:hypothetical protein